ncbi:3-hydroxyacyl-ACP dehydratase FabZ [Alkanindiges sp. WGS2144]|uniref:3-hydroxyacyl-ACP dehydratase FabZ n=1 Tax=Alkanindiges sp. WGS2144 TaxID=3366808 RepID=UPI0037536F53
MIKNTPTVTLDYQLPMQADTIRSFLPQRYPFLLVDRITEVVPNKYIKALKNVSINEEYFQGHFPGLPIMPGVLILESMAQIAGMLGFISVGKRPRDGYMFLFAGSDKVRFKRQVVPGDTLIISAELVMQRGGILKFACQAHVEDKLAASAEVLVSEQQITLI